MAPGPVLRGFSFFPRGGSAQVVRYLTEALLEAGWSPRIVGGSLGDPGNPSHAATFFTGLPLSPVDFTPALDALQRGEDPLDQLVPLHASYEDKAGARTASSRRSRLSWPRGKWTHGGVGCSR